MPTRVDQQTRIQNFFNNPAYYDVQSLNDSIQDGVDEICAFTGCVFRSAVLPFTQYTTYYDMLSLLPDYVGIVAMWNNTIHRWMFPQSLRKFNQVRIDWDNAYGTPYYFSVVNHRYVAIYMKPSVPDYGNMIIFYRASAPPLGDTTQIPIPEDHITCLDSYNITDLWEQSQEFSKAEDYLKNYISDLERLRTVIKNKRNPDRMMSLR